MKHERYCYIRAEDAFVCVCVCVQCGGLRKNRFALPNYSSFRCAIEIDVMAALEKAHKGPNGHGIDFCEIIQTFWDQKCLF